MKPWCWRWSPLRFLKTQVDLVREERDIPSCGVNGASIRDTVESSPFKFEVSEELCYNLRWQIVHMDALVAGDWYHYVVGKAMQETQGKPVSSISVGKVARYLWQMPQVEHPQRAGNLPLTDACFVRVRLA